MRFRWRAGRKKERKSNCGWTEGQRKGWTWAERKERCKRTVGSTWVLARRGEGQFAVCCKCFITGKRTLAATEFWMSYRPGQEKRARQSLKTRNWNPLPREPHRPQIARVNTFVPDRPQFASLHCACERARSSACLCIKRGIMDFSLISERSIFLNYHDI